ncbi:MAG: transporter [Desulfobacteraceae bacterium 4572_88]|nr:MAG: transporter [Desulfobacteraceae bacterium 4572_88]
MIVLNSLFPVFALLVLGSLLKRFGLSNETFLKTSDKLVYFIFFPAMLFWKIGGAASTGETEWGLCKAALASVFAIYILSSLYIRFSNVTDYEAGTFSQSCYRFNTYIGMAIIMNALGEEGIRLFGIMIGLAIPIINVLAVSTLIWFSGKSFTLSQRIQMTLRSLVSNPLILACVAGLLYSKFVSTFPVAVGNMLRLATSVTLPLALLSIGGTLTFANLKGAFRLSLVASVFKLLIFPVIGYFFLNAFDVTGISLRVGLIFFTLPTATSIYVLSAQLNSDTELASAAIVLSTVLSFFSMSVALLI